MTTISRAAVVDACRYFDTWLAFRFRSIGFPACRRRCSTATTSCCRPRTASRHDHRRAVDRRHLFRIASHSKTFTATAMMQLVEHGAVGSTTPSASWLPDLVESPVASGHRARAAGPRRRGGARRVGRRLLAAVPAFPTPTSCSGSPSTTRPSSPATNGSSTRTSATRCSVSSSSGRADSRTPTTSPSTSSIGSGSPTPGPSSTRLGRASTPAVTAL